MLCAEQLKVFDRLRDANAGVCLITGDAGTGKTTLAAELVKYRLRLGEEVQVLAPTHQAKQVLRARLPNNPRLSVDTVASFLTQHPVIEKDSGRMKFVAGAFGGTSARLVVVDETSMVSEHELRELAQARHDALIVFLGDFAQLRPVMKKQNTALERMTTFYLREQHRNGSRILQLCNALRSELVWPRESTRDVRVHDYRRLMLRRFLRDVTSSEDPTDACYLAYRNRTVNYVRMIAHRALYGDAPFVRGQILRLDGTCSVGYNGTLVRVVGIDGGMNTRILGQRFYTYSLRLRSLDDGVLGTEHVVSLEDQHRMNRLLEWAYEESAKSFMRDKERWREIRSEIERARKITAHSSPVVSTVHKSQGRTVPRVYVDTQDINSGSDKRRLMYVACSRASQQLHTVRVLEGRRK